MKNNRVTTKLPIQKGLLTLILKHIAGIYSTQPYLKIMYQALFITSYFGLCRIGELTSGTHPVLAPDVHIAGNKEKFKLVLRSSKTHTRSDKPQVIKVESDYLQDHSEIPASVHSKPSIIQLSPYEYLRKYSRVRRSCIKVNEPFFIFRDRSPVKPYQMRNVLWMALEKANLDSTFYCVHSLRSGRAADLLLMNLSLESVKKIGRWKSNAVYKYLAY